MSPAAQIQPGAVVLNVADLDRELDFYQRSIGLEAMEHSPAGALLGADGVAVVELAHAPEGPARPPGTTGLFHLAIRLSGRAELARALRRLTASGWPLAGASDHLVSEALYLSDPEGNGIEVYRDRPRSEWRYDGGELRMATLPLDLRPLIAEAEEDGPPNGAGARIGHVHLNVADLDECEAFYGGLLGFEVTVRSYPGALFMSTGGYHHHLGLNTWAGAGASPPPPGALGLRRFELLVGGAAELEELAARLELAGVPMERGSGWIELADPSGIGVSLATANGR